MSFAQQHAVFCSAVTKSQIWPWTEKQNGKSQRVSDIPWRKCQKQMDASSRPLIPYLHVIHVLYTPISSHVHLIYMKHALTPFRFTSMERLYSVHKFCVNLKTQRRRQRSVRPVYDVTRRVHMEDVAQDRNTETNKSPSDSITASSDQVDGASPALAASFNRRVLSHVVF